MYNIFTPKGRCTHHSGDKVWRFAVKVGFLYILILTGSIPLLMASTGNGQGLDDIQVTVEMKGENLIALFNKIEKQTSLKFVYVNHQVEGYNAVRFPKVDRTVKETLDLGLTGTRLDYDLVNGNVLIYRAEDLPDHASAEDLFTELRRQLGSVRGKVTDAATGNPLSEANVFFEGTSRGTATNVDGEYTLENVAPGTYTLVVTFLGYERQTREITVRDGQTTTADFALQTVTDELGEVEINAGYYTISDRNRTGSISKVTAEDISGQPVTSPLMALQGRVAGLEISPASGTPGIAPTIRIRGNNSLRVLAAGKSIPGVNVEGNYPLYVIDGVPVNSSPIVTRGGEAEVSVLGGGYDPLSTINPENIASIEVLKDADATSIYGSRGANGVILITTKQGRPSSKTDADLSVYMGMGEISNRVDLLNTEQYLQMRREAFANDGMEPNPSFTFHADINGMWDQDRNTDWQKVLLGGTADITDIQGSVSGGNANTSYRLGGGFHKETLIFPGDFGYKRASGHLSVNHVSENQRFIASVSLNYGVGKHNVYHGNLVGEALTLPPNAPELYDEQGELNWEVDPNFGETWTNPLAVLESSHTADNRNLIANGTLAYSIFPDLNIKANLGYTELHGEENIQTPFTSMLPRFRFSPENPFGIKPSAFFNNNDRRSLLVEPQLNYQKQFQNHALDILLGATYQENWDERLQIQGREYASDAFLGSIRGAETVDISIEHYNEYKYNALFGRIGYTYKDRFLLNLTGRRDGSSRFGPGERFGNFGAVGAAWIFSDEPWIKNHVPVISFGKVRASYGTTGNDQIGNYRYLDLYGFSTLNYQNATSLSPNALFNSDYQWEVTRKLEAAIEIGLAENRASLEVSWYRNRSSNQLIERAMPSTTGFSSINDNFSEATVENSGWEFLLRGDILRSNTVQWTTSVNLTISRNKLVEFPGIEDSPYATIFKVGEPLSIQRLYTWQGVNPETGEHEFLDVNDDGVINDEDRRFSNALDREYYGGVNNSVRYKGFELSFLFQFSRQNARYLPGGPPGSLSNQPVDVLRRWQEDGDMTGVQRFSQAFAVNRWYNQLVGSDANIEDASFIRLKTLSLLYRLPRSVLEKIGSKQIEVFVRGQNLFTITNYSGLDPETGFAAPPLRIITIGTQLQF